MKREDDKGELSISLTEDNSLIETNYLLSGKNGEILRASVADAKAGKVESHDLIEII